MKKGLFKKYYSALAKEGIIKAAVYGLIVGVFLSLALIIAGLIYKQNWLWLSILVIFAALTIISPLLYFIKFKPTSKGIAARVDRLGLDERLITMVELQNDASYISMLQREDAASKLNALKHKRLKLSLYKPSVVLLSVLATVWVTLTVLSAVVFYESINPDTPIEPVKQEYIRVSYTAATGGYILGESEQIVLKGGESISVVAVANEGFKFDGWSDFTDSARRFDKKLNKNFSATAKFVSLSDDISSGGFPDSADNNGAGNSSASGGKLAPKNQIIDGESYYRDYYQQYYDEAMQILADGGEIPDRLKSIIERYFGVIV